MKNAEKKEIVDAIFKLLKTDFPHVASSDYKKLLSNAYNQCAKIATSETEMETTA